MPNEQSPRDDRFARYDTMSTEELQAILREDDSKPKGEESDLEMLLYVMEVLAKRRKENGEEKSPAEALESFKRNYYPLDKKTPVSTRNGISRWKRSLAAAAAVIAIILCGSLTVSAFGINIWDTAVRWTMDTFHFEHTAQTGEIQQTEVIQNSAFDVVLADLCVGENIVPTWMPDGYQFVELETSHTENTSYATAVYAKKDSKLVLFISDSAGDLVEATEKDAAAVDIYARNSYTFYIMEDHTRTKIVWMIDNYECILIGKITRDEARELIDSICIEIG